MDLETFLTIESNRRYIGFRKVYFEMTREDANAALLLSQIVYWHTPDRNGRTKLRVKKDGHLWLAKGDADWQSEIGLTAKQVRRAKKILLDRQLIVTAVYKFWKTPKTHYRLNDEVFVKALEAAFQGQPFSATTLLEEINSRLDELRANDNHA